MQDERKQPFSDPLLLYVMEYRKNLMRRMYDAGIQQTVIADVFEVTRQSVHHLLLEYKRERKLALARERELEWELDEEYEEATEGALHAIS